MSCALTASHSLCRSLSPKKRKTTTPKPKKEKPKKDKAPTISASNLPQPSFGLSHAPTSKARCKGCDKVIDKASLRVSHRPNFRGKPGYKVYYHVDCVHFAGVDSAGDLDGYSDLDEEEAMLIDERVAKCKLEAKKKETEPELKPDELIPVEFSGPLRPQPSSLNATLLPYQRTGASWMYQQEVPSVSTPNSTPISTSAAPVTATVTSGCLGGILADEMGMGKTIQTIAVILDNLPIQNTGSNGSGKGNNDDDDDDDDDDDSKYYDDDDDDDDSSCEIIPLCLPVSRNYPANNKKKPSKPKQKTTSAQEKLWVKASGDFFKEMKMNDIPEALHTNLPLRAGTMIVCPMVALSQWKSEIEKFVHPNKALSVLIYHGPSRAKISKETLAAADIVLTTYQTIEVSACQLGIVQTTCLGQTQ